MDHNYFQVINYFLFSNFATTDSDVQLFSFNHFYFLHGDFCL